MISKQRPQVGPLGSSNIQINFIKLYPIRQWITVVVLSDYELYSAVVSKLNENINLMDPSYSGGGLR